MGGHAAALGGGESMILNHSPTGLCRSLLRTLRKTRGEAPMASDEGGHPVPGIKGKRPR